MHRLWTILDQDSFSRWCPLDWRVNDLWGEGLWQCWRQKRSLCAAGSTVMLQPRCWDEGSYFLEDLLKPHQQSCMVGISCDFQLCYRFLWISICSSVAATILPFTIFMDKLISWNETFWWFFLGRIISKLSWDKHLTVELDDLRDLCQPWWLYGLGQAHSVLMYAFINLCGFQS